MAITNPALLGLQHVLKIHTGHGDVEIDPAVDPLGYKRLLEESSDERVRVDRAAQDAANPNPLAPGRNPVMEQFNRMQTDMATGPGGYNRQWTSFFEAPRVLADNTGMKVSVDPRGLEDHGIADDPTSTFNTAEGPYGKFGTGANTLAGLSVKPKKPMPESHEAFMARLASQYGKR